jgi:hypothetical protein
MTPHYISEVERALIIVALLDHARVERDRAAALSHEGGLRKVADSIKRLRLAAEYHRLAMLFDGADMVDIWPRAKD